MFSYSFFQVVIHKYIRLFFVIAIRRGGGFVPNEAIFQALILYDERHKRIPKCIWVLPRASAAADAMTASDKLTISKSQILNHK